MAFTRKALSTMGLEEDKIDQIIEMHTEVTSALKDEKNKYKEEAERLPAVQKELDELKEAMKNGENSPYKEKYETAVEEKKALQKEYDQYKEDQKNKEVHEAKVKAYRDILKDAGIPEKHYAKILKYSDVDGVEMDDDGKIKTAKEILEAVKEEWSDHIQTKGTQGAQTNTPPADNGGSAGDIPSRAAKLAMKYHEDLYGKAKEVD